MASAANDFKKTGNDLLNPGNYDYWMFEPVETINVKHSEDTTTDNGVNCYSLEGTESDTAYTPQRQSHTTINIFISHRS